MSVPIAQVVEYPLRRQEVVGSNSGRAMQNTLKLVLVATLFVAQKSNRKAMNRNWSNQKANPALKTKMGNK